MAALMTFEMGKGFCLHGNPKAPKANFLETDMYLALKGECHEMFIFLCVLFLYIDS